MEFLGPLSKLKFPPIEVAILNMLKGALDYPASIEARASKIASDIVFCCTQHDSDTHVSYVLVCTWDAVIELVSCIPPDHEWHRCLVQALATVRKREGTADEDDPSGGEWSDLPQLTIRVREYCEYKPSEGDEESPSSLEQWKNFTSFISQLVNSGYTSIIYLALWEIFEALESTPTEVKALFDCQVWATTEWILQCSESLMKEMTPSEGQETLKKAPGPLFGTDKPPRSLQRWDFWKKRLGEISNESEVLGIEAETKIRIEKALKFNKLINGILGDPAPFPPGQSYFTICAYTAYPQSRGAVINIMQHITGPDITDPVDFKNGFFSDDSGFDLALHIWAFKKQREVVHKMKFCGSDIPS
ncbi:hypothetical protein S40288_10182 [Stachybotrys chartarum IBT 40288]|nr:hypothetical protein S40288_10182 [Stachybotrys chartarum IBT 40288]